MLNEFLINLLVAFIFTPLFWKLISKGALKLSKFSEKIALSLSSNN